MPIKKISKLTSAVAALVLAVNAFSGVSFASSKTVYEFEDGNVGTGASIENALPGYSGSGYVDCREATVGVDVTVPAAGMYTVTITYCLPDDRGGKEQHLYVNGTHQGSVNFGVTAGKFVPINAGVVKLKAGVNTIELRHSWGWVYVDCLSVEPTALPALSSSNSLINKNATEETKRLMSYLADIYGKNILSGQQELYGQAGETEFNFIKTTTGKEPAIRGFDYMNWTQGVNWNDGTNTRIKNWVNEKGGIATLCWHWFVPLTVGSSYPTNLGGGSFSEYPKIGHENTSFYNQKGNSDKPTYFSPLKAVTPGTIENDFINTDIEMIANALKELQSAGIPVLWRPLHEAEGSGGGAWFWWGSDGAEGYKQLWKYLYNKLTNEYGLNNLIWIYNSYTTPQSASWYPGDEYVDIVGYDKYNAGSSPNESAISSTFYSLVELTDGKKMVAMTENDTIPNISNLIDESAGWLYFCPWYSEFITSSKYQNPATLKDIYNSDYCITLDELPKGLYSSYPIGSTTPTGTAKTVYGDANDDGGVSIEDVVAVRLFCMKPDKYPLSEQGTKNALVITGQATVQGNCAVAIQDYVVERINTLPIGMVQPFGE